MTAPIIQPHQKKAFIYWFLDRYQLKTIESHWILTYLASQQKLLRNVHFVRNAKVCPRSIIISTNCSEGAAFSFYRGHIVTSDPEKAFHDIRLNSEEPLFIELRFQQWEKCPQYASILEENPFISDEDEITPEDKKSVAQLLKKSLSSYKRDLLLEKIDQALDERNEVEFYKLTKQLKEIENSLTNQPIS